MKNRLFLAVGCTLLLAPFAGCSGGDKNDEPPPVTLNNNTAASASGSNVNVDVNSSASSASSSAAGTAPATTSTTTTTTNDTTNTVTQQTTPSGTSTQVSTSGKATATTGAATTTSTTSVAPGVNVTSQTHVGSSKMANLPGWPSKGARKTMPGGLEYYDVLVGSGPEIKTGDVASMQYTGYLEDGTKFDSSYDHGGAPFPFILGLGGQVIKGWDLGVAGMKVGGKRILVIPSELGYGTAGSPPKIPGGATLIFDVELVNNK